MIEQANNPWPLAPNIGGVPHIGGVPLLSSTVIPKGRVVHVKSDEPGVFLLRMPERFIAHPDPVRDIDLMLNRPRLWAAETERRRAARAGKITPGEIGAAIGFAVGIAAALAVIL